MNYKCKTIPLNKLVAYDGCVKSLCTECLANDCSNNVEIRNISILGTMQKYRLLNRGDDFYIVYDCDGFTNATPIEEDDE